MAVAAIGREILLRQNASDPNDAASPLEKSHALAVLLRTLHDAATAALRAGVAMRDLDLGSARRALTAVRDAAAPNVAPRANAARAAITAVSSQGPQ